ncbi:amidohydrolase family protein [Nocardia wallacei]|uniref:amidohydrolase family protein n=1 Tax=Nocardia wallacei TaxID=480035 RepID=UPI002454B74A|nr:amidohydrolase family protein [Nocardia wallacei]
MTSHRIIAVEEHFVTSTFLQRAHTLDICPSDRTEVDLTRSVESHDPTRSQLLDLTARLAVMDAAGQDMALLSLNPPGVQPYKPADAVDLARDFNDELAQIVRDHPSRFAGLATVAPQAPDAAADEIERAVDTLGLHGIMINSHTNGHYLDEPQFAPLLQAAQAHHAPIYLHPRIPSMLGQYAPYGLSGAIWGYGAEAGLHAMRLIMSGTLDRYPNLQIVIGHLGEGIPYYLRRIDNRYAFARRIAGAATPTSQLELTPSAYFRRNFTITTSGIDDPNALEYALRTVGDDNIMFAIDTPYEETTEALRFLTSAPLSEEQRANISHRTAERVFGLQGSKRGGSAAEVS